MLLVLKRLVRLIEAVSLAKRMSSATAKKDDAAVGGKLDGISGGKADACVVNVQIAIPGAILAKETVLAS